jgi:hypothetical protein
MTPLRHTIITLLGLIFLLYSCSDDAAFYGECKRDSDCKEYEKCDLLDYRCICDTDQACAPGEFCNLSGFCQVKTSCVSNMDCPDAGTFCDLTSGECIESASCSTDVQCDIGQICENSTCSPGCRETSDCDLMDREVCVNGDCVPGRCENNKYCDFGMVCNLQTKSCELPAEPHCSQGCDPICSGCTNPAEGPCGNPANICVQETQNTHCWVACQTDDQCPSGYRCLPTTVGWEYWKNNLCDTTEECTLYAPADDRVVNVCGAVSHRCRLNQQPCDTDADCYPFNTICLSDLGDCVFGYHCRPKASGCE